MSRRLTVLSTVIGAFALAGLGFGFANAQTGAGANTGSSTPDGEVGVQRQANLSGAQQLAEAQRIQARGEQISRHVSSMLDDARREQDIIRVTCTNDKLTQINATNRNLAPRVEALQSAVDSSNSANRNHEFTVITVYGQNLALLEQDANRCISQDIFETGATQVTTEIDPANPDENPNDMPQTPDLPVPSIPAPDSPTI